MDWICIVIGVLFLICLISGWVRGLFKVLLSVAGMIASIIVATYVAPGISGYLEEHTQWDDNIAAYISEELSFSDSENEVSKGVQVEVINDLPISEALKASILDNNNSEMYSALDATGVYDYIAKSMSVVILNAVVFLVLGVVAHVFFVSLGKAVEGLTKLPILRSIDKLGGLTLGGMQALILIWILFLILSITSTSEISQEMIEAISQVSCLKLLYDNNVLLDIVGDLTRVLFL
ncbi:MAG: CvpA family protein [Lachnospiraceae bacterium]|nr:CvpA family protein [Lachnospiraceae bacterium]